jgi:uncharacterized protein YgbK (DUF1537 family)
MVYRLDRQPTMSRHPVTPMHESDLAVHLSRQTSLPIGHMPFTAYGDDPAEFGRRLRAAPEAALVLDALTDDHVAFAAAAITADAAAGTPRFAIGSGGLSTGLGRALGRPADGGGAAAEPLNAVGPVLAVSGSRSPQTARQVEAARAAGWAVIALPFGAADPVAAVRDAVLDLLDAGRSVVVTTGDAEPASDAAGLVAAIAANLAGIVEAALRAGATRRVIVCGGDTSSRVVGLLGAESLSIAANPVGNVVLCAVASPEAWLDGAELLLKGGQVGDADLFEVVRALGD